MTVETRKKTVKGNSIMDCVTKLALTLSAWNGTFISLTIVNNQDDSNGKRLKATLEFIDYT